jgi:hypothetical protein
VVKCLPSKHETLSSITSTTKKEEGRKGEREGGRKEGRKEEKKERES